MSALLFYQSPSRHSPPVRSTVQHQFPRRPVAQERIRRTSRKCDDPPADAAVWRRRRAVPASADERVVRQKGTDMMSDNQIINDGIKLAQAIRPLLIGHTTEVI